MAHSTFHFSLGLAVGMLALLPGLLGRMKRKERLSPAVARWLFVAYSIGMFAIVPNLLRRVGIPDAVCTGWWMNIFLFHPLIDRVKDGGVLIAEVMVLGCFGLQYLLILVMLKRRLRRGSMHSASDQHCC
jgi:hypothetical protein